VKVIRMNAGGVKDRNSGERWQARQTKVKEERKKERKQESKKARK
jgi:hypothetical protein